MSSEKVSGARISDTVALFEWLDCPALVNAREITIDSDAREKRRSSAASRKVLGPGVVVRDPEQRSSLARGSKKEHHEEGYQSRKSDSSHVYCSSRLRAVMFNTEANF